MTGSIEVFMDFPPLNRKKKRKKEQEKKKNYFPILHNWPWSQIGSGYSC